MGIASALLRSGNRCLEAGLYDDAARLYWWSHDLAVTHMEPHYNLLVLSLRAGPVQPAISVEQTVEQIASERPDLAGRLGITDPARAHEQLLGHVETSGPIAPLGPDEVSDEFAQEPRVAFTHHFQFLDLGEEVDAAMERGLACMQRGEYLDAIEAYWDVLQRDPSTTRAYTNLAAASNIMRRYDEAALYADAATRLDPANAIAFHNLGVSRYCLGDFAGAIDAYEYALPVADDPDLIEQSIAQARERLESPESAPPMWPEALAERKGDAEFYRLGFAVNFLDIGRVASWIDTELGVPDHELGVSGEAEPLMMRLASGESEIEIHQAAMTRLRNVPGTVDPEVPARVLLGLIGKKLKNDLDTWRHSSMRMAIRIQHLTGALSHHALFPGVRINFGPKGAGFTGERMTYVLDAYEAEADAFINSGTIR